jgi:hypothetical protein
MAQSPVRPFWSCLILIVVLFTACTNRNAKAIDSNVLSVFSDFALVGTVPYQGKSELDRTVPAHGSSPLPLPSQLEAGKLYIFHHRRPLDGEQLALSELPTRLQRQGIQITQAPRSPKDLMFPYLGGPIFTIRFKDGKHSGFIFSQVCSNLTKEIDAGWTGTDYVLVYTE